MDNKQSPAVSPSSHISLIAPSSGGSKGRSPAWPPSTTWSHSGTASRHPSGSSSVGGPDGWPQSQSRSTSAGWKDDTNASVSDVRDTLYTDRRQASSAQSAHFPRQSSDEPPQALRRSSQPINSVSATLNTNMRSSSGSALDSSRGMSGLEFIQQAESEQRRSSVQDVAFPTLSPVMPSNPHKAIMPRSSYSEFPLAAAPASTGHYHSQQAIANQQPRTHNPLVLHQQAVTGMPAPQVYSVPAIRGMPSPTAPNFYTDIMHTPGPPSFPNAYHFAPSGMPMSPLMYSPHLVGSSPVMPHNTLRGHSVPMLSVPIPNAQLQQSTYPATWTDHKMEQRNQILRGHAMPMPLVTMPGPYASYPSSPLSPLPPQMGRRQPAFPVRGGAPNHARLASVGTIKRATPARSPVGHGSMALHQRQLSAPVEPVNRSALLEDFRNNKARKWELSDIHGHIVEFSGDQHGSRFIQQKVESADEHERDRIFSEIMPDHLLDLVSDVFGNYVIQKLLDHSTQDQRDTVIEALRGHIFRLSNNMYGCRVVQCVLDHSSSEQQDDIVRELDSHVMECVVNQNGNHVIQKIFERVDESKLGFIAAFNGRVLELGQHPYGCRVLQRCFEHITNDRTRLLMDELLRHAIVLTEDQFGNYVIQYVIEHGDALDREAVVSRLKGRLIPFSKHKYASNVCEKALQHSAAFDRDVLIGEILHRGKDGGTFVAPMVKDMYANYVLQSAMKVAEGDLRHALYKELRTAVPHMRRFAMASAKHLNAIQRILDQHPDAGIESAEPHLV